MKKEFRLKVSKAGAVTIQNIINSKYSIGFKTPDCDGLRFDDFMSKLKEDDIMLLRRLRNEI